MSLFHITHDDLYEQLRLQLNINDFKTLEKAYLERNGNISFVEKK